MYLNVKKSLKSWKLFSSIYTKSNCYETITTEFSEKKSEYVHEPKLALAQSKFKLLKTVKIFLTAEFFKP